MEDILIEGNPYSDIPFGAIINAIVLFTQNVTTTLSSWGYFGLFALMTLESSSLPIPSEIILPFAGFLVSQSLLNFWLAVVVSTLAGIIGSLIDYYIGLKGTSFLARRSSIKKVLYDSGRMDLAEKWFKKYGARTVFLCRLIPGFRTLISFPAGAFEMPLPKFIVYTTAGCLLWDIILISIGVYLGENWRSVATVANYLIIAFAVMFIVILILLLLRRKKKK